MKKSFVFGILMALRCGGGGEKQTDTTLPREENATIDFSGVV